MAVAVTREILKTLAIVTHLFLSLLSFSLCSRVFFFFFAFFGVGVFDSMWLSSY